MLHPLLKWGVILSLWRRYGAALKWLPLVLFLVLVIYSIHKDYVGYVEVSQKPDHLAISFLIKWAAIVSVLIAYWLYARTVLKPPSKTSLKSRFTSSVKAQKESTEQKGAKADSSEPPQGHDPFRNIRKKKKLRSKGDLLTGEGADDQR